MDFDFEFDYEDPNTPEDYPCSVVEVHYEVDVVDESFSHAFGTQESIGFGDPKIWHVFVNGKEMNLKTIDKDFLEVINEEIENHLKDQIPE
jgi:hypothetical protein